MSDLLAAVKSAGEDFEWYPTTDAMIRVVLRHIPAEAHAIMDIGAGDGRVLAQIGKKCERATLYGIEKSIVLLQAQPQNIVPVGTEFFEQNLACLPVDYIFCNPPYSEYALWVSAIIEAGYAKKAFLIIPERWKDSKEIAAAIARRGAKTRVIGSDNFYNAERAARAVVDIVEVTYPKKELRWEEVEDPFDIWFENNITTFDPEKTLPEDERQAGLAKIRGLDTVAEMVAAYDEELARMEENYRAIFRLDYALLKELGVNKNAVREGIKKKMVGLKTKYWEILFERLDSITKRLSTETRRKFLETLSERATIGFTVSNAYAVVIWAIKNANQYFNEQTVKLFRDLSTHDGVQNYKSNARAWEKHAWRYRSGDYTHYALDYRIVVKGHSAIWGGEFGQYEYPANLHRRCHDLIADIVAVLYNLGFATDSPASFNRSWVGGEWQDWTLHKSDTVLFQVKAYLNGNMHLRFMPDAIKALNIEAGRLLGWLHSPKDAEVELGYTDAARFFGTMRGLPTSYMPLQLSA